MEELANSCQLCRKNLGQLQRICTQYWLLPLCSVIRPTSTQHAGAKATVAFFTAMGLFQGQSNQFFAFVSTLAQAADEASGDSE